MYDSGVQKTQHSEDMWRASQFQAQLNILRKDLDYSLQTNLVLRCISNFASSFCLVISFLPATLFSFSLLIFHFWSAGLMGEMLSDSHETSRNCQ